MGGDGDGLADEGGDQRGAVPGRLDLVEDDVVATAFDDLARQREVVAEEGPSALVEAEGAAGIRVDQDVARVVCQNNWKLAGRSAASRANVPFRSTLTTTTPRATPRSSATGVANCSAG